MKQQKNNQIITFKQTSCCFQIPLEILNVYCGKIYTIIVNKRSGEHLSFAWRDDQTLETYSTLETNL